MEQKWTNLSRKMEGKGLCCQDNFAETVTRYFGIARVVGKTVGARVRKHKNWQSNPEVLPSRVGILIHRRQPCHYSSQFSVLTFDTLRHRNLLPSTHLFRFPIVEHNDLTIPHVEQFRLGRYSRRLYLLSRACVRDWMRI